MATIALYANKINQMPGLIKDVKKSVADYQSELSSLKKQSLKINQSICNLDDVVSLIQASTQTQEQKIASLETFRQNSEQFIEETARIDSDVADVINQRKDDFYEQYNYLKPECEKNGWEKFCDGCKKAGEWCKEHWQELLLAIEIIVAVVCLFIPAAQGFGVFLLKHIVKGMLEGLLMGAVIGAVSGYAQYGAKGILGGMLSGAKEGAVMGGIFGGLGGVGEVLGSSCKVLGFLGNAAKIIPTISKVSGVISLGMAGFDLLSLGAGLILGQDNSLTAINRKLHSSKLYNTLQIGVSALAVFSGGFTKGMKNPTCFVAGTLVLTASGLVAIENIKAGDKVISTDPETFETAEKTVLETYVREDNKLIHLLINDEEIVTTETHPFYVKAKGFINAIDLYIGDKLRDSNGNTLMVEDRKIEILNKPVKVYNFKVENFHTYHVGENGIWVHNADCSKKQVLADNQKKGKEAQEARHNELVEIHPETQSEITIRPLDDNGKLVDYNVRVDELTNEFFNEVKSTETAQYTKNQLKGYELLQRNGGVIRGAGKPGFEGKTVLGPTQGYTTRNGTTLPILEDMLTHGGK